ncbi:MAG: hypothetical protein H6548_01475 [Chitinophagales bacterium]|mgnify:CR=1 FL=1|nr:hypothetical protein [Chitinophagales bacterium]HAE13270.1 hypothetical protein [Bacteroidota bacterium]MCB9020768.1 hypothetical protein [Chitinophagales bacterium]HAE34778.1 hypothetical protein [Bacteroidota bacterium]HPE97178.1 hypothetical protein [Chitinophagales bacterium]
MLPTIRFQLETDMQAEYAWIIRAWGRYSGFTPLFVETEPELTVSELGISDIRLSHFFRNTYLHGDHHAKAYFATAPVHLHAGGQTDHLSTAFYMLSCQQEYAPFEGDKYGRFAFADSWQYRFDAADKNLVAFHFDQLTKSLPLVQQKILKQDHASRLFCTHDIDTVFGAWTEQRKALLKKGRVGTLLQLMFRHITGRYDYLELEKILAIEDAYDVRSVFFWLTERGRGRNGIENADYHIDDPAIRKKMQLVSAAGGSNGLHKSALQTTYTEELERLHADGLISNRNHYLRFFMPDTWRVMEQAGVALDATLGFAEQPGFRAGYGLPYRPFDVSGRREIALTEVPLLVMDTTYRHYLKKDPATAGKEIINLLDKHRQDAVINILWHNNYFFDLAEPGWLQVYKDVLAWARDNAIRSVMPEDLIIQ